MAEPPLTDRPDRRRGSSIRTPVPSSRSLDDAVEAEIELAHETTVVEAERGLVRRVARVVAGFTLVFVGILLLVLPGPGLLVIAAGLGLLSRDVPFARRWLAHRAQSHPRGRGRRGGGVGGLRLSHPGDRERDRVDRLARPALTTGLTRPVRGRGRPGLPARMPAVKPPSTTSVWPVTNEASSDARKAAAAAISSGRPKRSSLWASR